MALEGISSTIAKGMAESSKHHAEMSEGFDPFGFKTAFKAMHEQNEAIQAVQQAEIERLTKECKRLKRELRQLKKKRKKSESKR